MIDIILVAVLSLGASVLVLLVGGAGLFAMSVLADIRRARRRRDDDEVWDAIERGEDPGVKR